VKSHKLSDRGRVARGLTRRHAEESIFHHISTYRGWRVQESHARRNRESRFPDLIGAVNHRRDRWHEIPRSRGSTFRHFQSQKAHGVTAKSRAATGPTGAAGSASTWHRTSVFEVLKVRELTSRVAIAR
jgi:hypothetical protein